MTRLRQWIRARRALDWAAIATAGDVGLLRPFQDWGPRP